MWRTLVEVEANRISDVEQGPKWPRAVGLLWSAGWERGRRTIKRVVASRGVLASEVFTLAACSFRVERHSTDGGDRADLLVKPEHHAVHVNPLFRSRRVGEDVALNFAPSCRSPTALPPSGPIPLNSSSGPSGSAPRWHKPFSRRLSTNMGTSLARHCHRVNPYLRYRKASIARVRYGAGRCGC